MTKPLVYIAGPYTHPDPIVNVRRACTIADQLDSLGCATFIPHLSMLWHLVSPQPIEVWYRRDLDVLAHCDALVRFSGTTVGADREWEVAVELGMPCFVLFGNDDKPETPELIMWIARRRGLPNLHNMRIAPHT